MEGALIMDRYLILEMLGHGSEGVVYKAIDTEKDIQVAVKIQSINDEDAIQYHLELINNNLCSEYIVKIYDYFLHYRMYIIMQLLNFPTIDKLLDVWDGDREVREFNGLKPLEANPRSLIEAYIIIKQLFIALDCLHSNDYYHGDLQPGNIMWTGEKIIFFDLTNHPDLGPQHDLHWLMNKVVIPIATCRRSMYVRRIEDIYGYEENSMLAEKILKLCQIKSNNTKNYLLVLNS